MTALPVRTMFAKSALALAAVPVVALQPHPLPTMTDVMLADFSSHIIDIDDSAKGVVSCAPSGCDTIPVTSVDEAYDADAAITNSADLVAVSGYGNIAAQLGVRQADFDGLPAVQELVLIRDTSDSHGLLARLGVVKATPVIDLSRSVALTVRMEYDPLVDLQNNGLIGIGAAVADLNSFVALGMSNKADYQAIGTDPPQIVTQNGSTTDILLTREAPLITAIRGMALVGPDLATITAPVIQKLVDDDYNRDSKSFTLVESLNQNVNDIKAIVTGLQQGIADDIARHKAPAPAGGSTPSAATGVSVQKVAKTTQLKATKKTVGQAAAKHRRAS